MRSEFLLKKNLKNKLNESLSATSPIIIIVILLVSFFINTPAGLVLGFLWGAFLLILGMMLFTLGAEMSMTKIGEQMGSSITKSRKIALVIIASFLIGFVITVAEPDLQVLSSQVTSIPKKLLTLGVSLGVGLFLVAAVLRMLFGIPLSRMLVAVYALVFAVTFFVPEEFIAVAFDSGGVTTGPMTVPFIIAFGVGISEIRSDRHAADDSFGLVALCSVGPILAVMLLGIIFGGNSSGQSVFEIPNIEYSTDFTVLLTKIFPGYLKEIAMSLLPVIILYALFRLMFRKVSKSFTKIAMGIALTYTGLVIFLTGVNAGFMPMGRYLGEKIAELEYNWILIPIAMIIGFFVVKAEPAVYVLNKQVEEITDGAISAKILGISLSVGVAVSLGLSMSRILFKIPILYFLIPGYLIAIVSSFFVPKLYTAIAFDSGGVASGPMTAAFILPLAQGACLAVGGDISKDAFGIVAMVAMTPLITIQILGFISVIKKKPSGEKTASDIPIQSVDEIIEI